MAAAPVLSALRRVRRRMRALRALGAALAALPPAALAALATAVAWRIGALGGGGARTALPCLAALAVALARLPLARVAQRVDESHGLAGRMTAAVAFLPAAAPSPFMRLALEDAGRRAAEIVPGRAARLRRPPRLWLAAVLGATASLVAVVRLPARGAAPPAPLAPPPRLFVDPALLDADRQAARDLARLAEEIGDRELARIAAELERLVARVGRGEVGRKELLERLAGLEGQATARREGDLEDLRRRLRRAGTELGRARLAEAAGRALEQERLDEARRGLEELARGVERGGGDASARRDLARALRRAADEAAARAKDDERRRPGDERLTRVKDALRRAAEAVGQPGPEGRARAAEALRSAGAGLGDLRAALERSLAADRASQAMADLRELVRRRGQSVPPSPTEPPLAAAGPRPGGEPRPRPGAPGQEGRPAPTGPALPATGLEEFLARAGARLGPAREFAPGEGGMLVSLPGEERARPGKPARDGIGDRHEDALLGDPTRLEGQRRDLRLEGRPGEGPSRSQTILGAAERGFAAVPYRKVWADYAAITEEEMAREQVPPGYRFYVKRYFQLVKPR